MDWGIDIVNHEYDEVKYFKRKLASTSGYNGVVYKRLMLNKNNQKIRF